MQLDHRSPPSQGQKRAWLREQRDVPVGSFLVLPHQLSTACTDHVPSLEAEKAGSWRSFEETRGLLGFAPALPQPSKEKNCSSQWEHFHNAWHLQITLSLENHPRWLSSTYRWGKKCSILCISGLGLSRVSSTHSLEDAASESSCLEKNLEDKHKLHRKTPLIPPRKGQSQTPAGSIPSCSWHQ